MKTVLAKCAQHIFEHSTTSEISRLSKIWKGSEQKLYGLAIEMGRLDWEDGAGISAAEKLENGELSLQDSIVREMIDLPCQSIVEVHAKLDIWRATIGATEANKNRFTSAEQLAFSAIDELAALLRPNLRVHK